MNIDFDTLINQLNIGKKDFLDKYKGTCAAYIDTLIKGINDGIKDFVRYKSIIENKGLDYFIQEYKNGKINKRYNNTGNKPFYELLWQTGVKQIIETAEKFLELNDA